MSKHLFTIRTPHDILKKSLCTNEEIWIYDEIHGVAVTVEDFNGNKMYAVSVYFPSSTVWRIIDIEATDEHGAQIMYDCAVKAVNDAKYRLHK